MVSKQGSSWRHHMGFSFEWTPEHLTSEQLRPLIFSYDVIASEALDRLDEISPPLPKYPSTDSRNPDQAEAKEGAEKPHRDLYQILSDNRDDETLQRLWNQVHTIPDWVDWEQIERGQRVFYRYAGPIIVALTFQSLLGGMGSRRVVETLTRTGGFGINVTRHRLLETFQHILQVTKSLASVQPSGDGFASSLRVRLLHASVRRRILQLAKAKPAYYSVADYGIPVNDLDSIGTIATFSATLIWLGLPRQGIFMRVAEVVDFLALWRWVAHVVGAPTAPFATPRAARAMMESLLASEMAPTPTGRVLAGNIIAALADQPPTFASRHFLAAEAHWLNGRELADALHVPRPPVYYSALVAGQCLFFMALTYGYRLVPAWDERRIERLRELLYKFTVRNSADRGGLGGESVFDFKYIPSLDMPGTAEAGPPRGVGAGLARGGVEGRNLKALLLGAALAAGVLAWGGRAVVRGVGAG